MTALLALELRLLWRHARPSWYLWVLFAFLATGQVTIVGPSNAFHRTWFLFPIMGLGVSGIGLLRSAESIGWMVPLRHSARTWARGVLLSALGLLSGGFLLIFYRVNGEGPREPELQ